MKNISRILPLIFLFCILSESTKSQSYRVSIDHFSDEDGLTHSSILKILQDRKGFIWLATYDGMVKFDGYKFKSIKVQPQDSITLKSNRVNSMHEDTYGRIWLKSNKDEAYCFDPNSNRFWALQNTSAYNNESFLLSRIKTTLSGRVWLLSQDSECICIMDSLYTLHSFRNKMGNKKVHGILEDRDKNTWILTNNGIGFISDDEFPSIRFHFEQGNSSGNVTSHSFFSSLELGDKILFGCASGKVWCYLKKSRAFYDLDINLNVNIVNILELNKDEIIIITRNKGFFTYNLLTNQLKTYNSHTVKGLQTEDMHALFVNSSNQLWFENNNTGIYKYDFQTESLSSFSTSSPTKASKWKFPPKTLIVRDCNKTLWLQPQGGIFSLYDPENDRLIPFKEIIKDSLSKISNIFEVAYFDRQNNLWFCSKTQGLAKASFTKNKFEQIRIMAPNTLFSSNNTRSIFEDSQKNIWIATKEESRLVLYNKNKEKIGFLSPNGEISDNTEWESAIYCIMQDRDMNIWLGTKGNGIYIFSPTNTHYKYNVQHFQHNPTDKFSLSSNGIYSIIQDHNGRIWIGTWKGGLNLAQKKNGRLRFIHSQNMLKNYPAGTYSNIRCMAEDKNGNIHIGSTNGLLSFSSDFKEISSIGYHGFKNFANHDILDILITRKNALYLSTFGGGLYKETEKNLEGFPLKFKKHHATTSNLTGGLLSIQEDKEDNIWIFSETNLIRFKPSDESFEVFPDVKNILGNSSFSESGSRVLSSGEILAGYSNGIIAFHPEQIQSNDFVPYLAFTDFQLSNLPSEDSQYLFFK
jgi:ligand-binding sensor domain-containing protein